MTVKERLAAYADFLDVGILRHGFAPHMRDYDVVFEALWGRKEWADEKGTYLLRFTHCPHALTVTTVADPAWREAWSDVFIDHAQWEAAGQPEGFVWGACWSTAYPGLTYVDDSARADEWSRRLAAPMHEIRMETDTFGLHVVFHDFTVTKLSTEVGVLDKVVFPLR